MAIRHLNQIELAARWNISHRTLERWRWVLARLDKLDHDLFGAG